jgi:hypothetical protein
MMHPLSTPRFLWKEAVVISMLIWSQCLGGLADMLSFVLLAGWALAGRRQALQALSVSGLIVLLNPGLFPDQTSGSFMKWLVLILAASRILLASIARPRRLPPSVIWLTLFAITAGVSSRVMSYDFAVSAFKLAAFYLAILAVLLAFHSSADLKYHWQSWLFTLFVVVLVSGLPLLVLKVGYFRNNQGFQGILNHPQAYGVFFAPLTAMAIGIWLERGRRLHAVALVALVGGLTLLSSQARTAVFAMLLSFLCTMLTAVLRRRDWLASMSGPWRKWTSLTVMLAMAAGLVSQSGLLERGTLGFLEKGNDALDASGGLRQARGRLMDMSWSNFLDHPILGIGFGLASDPSSFEVERHPILGIPVGASTEKGFMPTAVLEEDGIVGTIVLLLLLASLALPIIRRGSVAHSLLFWTCLFTNFGEMCFFAMGGLGLHIWLMMGFASACSVEIETVPNATHSLAKQPQHSPVRAYSRLSRRAG